MRGGFCAFLAAAALGSAGCGEDSSAVEPGAPPSLLVVSGAPAMPAEAPAAVELASAAPVVSLAARGALVVAGTDGGALFADGDVLSPLDVWLDDPANSLEPGPVLALARRRDNVLVVAGGGVFHTVGAWLAPSPASDALAALSIFDAAASLGDDDESLWLSAKDGLYELVSGELSRWSLPGDAAPSRVLPAGPRVYVAAGEELFELDRAARTALRIALPSGVIHALARGLDDRIYVAAERGLFERSPEGAIRHHTLSDGADPAPVDALAFEPRQGTYAAGAFGLVLLRPGESAVGVSPLPASASARAAAADDLGRLWIGGASGLLGFEVGEPLGFEADVLPVFQAYCDSCHSGGGAAGAPGIDLLDFETAKAWADVAIARVASGQMPPPGNPRVPGELLEIVSRWNESGQNP